MKQTRIIMGMPITLQIVDKGKKDMFKKVFNYFKHIDLKFSTYKKNSEISRINSGEIRLKDASEEMKCVFKLAEKTKKQTKGYFDIYFNNRFDPSGIVKGWAILKAAEILKKSGVNNFYIDAGGDIQVSGKNKTEKKWKIGIKNPFNQNEIVKVLEIQDKGVATSGTYIRGNHIYNPFDEISNDYVSLTVIGPNIFEADRFATAAFAMGKKGIGFIEGLKGFEGLLIDNKGIATLTSGFHKYEIN